MPYIEQLPATRNICLYNYLGNVVEDFKLDVKKAHEKIVISIPDGCDSFPKCRYVKNIS